METTKQRDTKLELRVRSLLHRCGLRFRVDQRPCDAVRSRADIVFRKLEIAVFLDGCFWHGCPLHGTWPKANAKWWRQKLEANRARDRRVVETLESEGWLVLRFWEHESPEYIAGQICKSVEVRASETQARSRMRSKRMHLHRTVP